MSKSDEASDYKLFSVQTNAKLPDVDNASIIKFDRNSKIIQENSKEKAKEIVYSVLKRTTDVVASGLALILLSPVFIVTSIAIKKDDNGPAMYTQQRIGKGGKLFKIYKFRTMRSNADEVLLDILKNDENAAKEYKINKKLKNDPRITKVGKILRKTSIDELPQLLNVFKGEMSLVGPRPYLPREMDDMGEYYNDIIESKPGITGLCANNYYEIQP